MSTRWSTVAGLAALFGAAAIAVAVARYLPAANADTAVAGYPIAIGLVTVLSAAVVVLRVDPAYTFSAAILLTPFAGNWPELGVPGPLSPDRLLLASGIAAVALRAGTMADRPRLRITGAHVFLGVAVVYALISALFAGTLFERDPLLKIIDAFGIMPFLVFLVGPLAFTRPHQRQVLLVTFVVLGAYLGFTVLFETVKLDALVFPKYILDPNFGIHVHRGRGPFVDAVANGLALYTCAVVCGVAVATWRDARARAIAAAIGVLCVTGAFLSLERSVWIGALFGTIIAMLATNGLRRYLVPVILAGAFGVAASLALIPGLTTTVQDRLNNPGTIWDRKNLARAAVNMVEARPLFGFGWSRFTSDSRDYFQQAFGYPLTATNAGVHNTPLTYGVDLGLIGMTLWILGLTFGLVGALATRGPPELYPWRVALLAIAAASLVVLNSVPPTAWLNRSLWLFAAVVYSGRYIMAPDPVAVAGAVAGRE
jgi:putative inorganic carbon (HCO3(-)) transporter